jgi:hypothetical protein
MIGDSDRARRIAALYYRRTAAANRLFSNYKAGWKTPRGMIYILFGPPLYAAYYQPPVSPVPAENYLAWDYPNERGVPFPGEGEFQYGAFALFGPLKEDRFPFRQELLRLFGGNVSISYQLSRQQRLWWSGEILTRRLFYRGGHVHQPPARALYQHREPWMEPYY